VGRLVVQACPEELSSEGTRICKSKAQSGTLLESSDLGCAFFVRGEGDREK